MDTHEVPSMLTKVLSDSPARKPDGQNNQTMPGPVWAKGDGLTARLIHDTQPQLLCPHCHETYFAGQQACCNCGMLLNYVGKTRQLRVVDLTETLRQIRLAEA